MYCLRDFKYKQLQLPQNNSSCGGYYQPNVSSEICGRKQIRTDTPMGYGGERQNGRNFLDVVLVSLRIGHPTITGKHIIVLTLYRDTITINSPLL